MATRGPRIHRALQDLRATGVSPAKLCHGWQLISHHTPGPPEESCISLRLPSSALQEGTCRFALWALQGSQTGFRRDPGSCGPAGSVRKVLLHSLLSVPDSMVCSKGDSVWRASETLGVWSHDMALLRAAQFLALAPLCVLTSSVSQRAHKEMLPPQLSDMRVYHHLAGSLSLAG